MPHAGPGVNAPAARTVAAAPSVPSGPPTAPPAPGAAAAAATTAARVAVAGVAVVVHYRDADSTQRCIASLRAQDPAPCVVVVDNASPDGSGRVLAAALASTPGVEVVHAARNGGFGAGCNLGIAHALARWPALPHVLLLNPDATLATGALAELAAVRLRYPAAGVVGCTIDDGAGRAWFENGRIPRWTLSGFHVAPDARVEHPTGFVTGACMLVAADLLRAGLRFDERYFLYCEDADLCEEVHARGREVWMTRRARASHRGGGSQPGRPVLGELTAERLYWLTRAKVLFAARRLSPLQRWSFLLVSALAKPVVGLLRTGSLRFFAPYWRGLRDGLRAASTHSRTPARTHRSTDGARG